ncbi:thiamine pyrophosphate-dependent enzyme [Alicyclobacillus tolerans]|uniref:thiamine pyrophosphate-dependent enzyme n=1 Tax=Alicyclobacillus tolerans TaxID=90970 RepID=UPI001F01D5A1|nr:thiamine pyrophosphate-dependent enzyme [Alicyclobacillus tolerans]MCF8566772.1 thiamine pyrophosphate-dependent enzyme [Alicyclobacillus tolerans]
MAALELRDYSNGNQPTWCPGCGDYSVLKAIQKGLFELKIAPENAVLVSGIGCSGKISHYFGGYGIHSTHGRALPVAQGIAASRPDVTVIAAGGDGDGYGIGIGHLIHAARRNLPVTYLVMDNGVYGNTKGQTSPTSPLGYRSSTSPAGNADLPIQPLQLAWSAGASFIAQGFSGNINHLVELVKKAILHPGFALINVFSPCVVFNKTNGYDFYRNAVTYREQPAASAAEYFQMLADDPFPLGVLWKSEREPAKQARFATVGSKTTDSMAPDSRVHDSQDGLLEYLRTSLV